jgi:hypothetical protein
VNGEFRQPQWEWESVCGERREGETAHTVADLDRRGTVAIGKGTDCQRDEAVYEAYPAALDLTKRARWPDVPCGRRKTALWKTFGRRAIARLQSADFGEAHESMAIGYSGVLASLVTRAKKDEMAARAGIEPMVRFLEACTAAISSASANTTDAQLHAQELAT